MDQDIEGFLRASVTADVLTILHKAVTAFEVFEIQDYEDSILDLILGAVDQEEQSLVSQVIGEFRAKLEYILGLHDIALLDTAPLAFVVDLCLGLKAIDDYLDMDSVIDICDGDEAKVERFAEVMALVTSYTSDEIMLQIDQVNEGLVEKIRALANQSTEILPDTATDRGIEAINSYRLQISPTELSYQSMLDAGLPLGLPFKTYLDFYANTNKNIDLADQSHLKQFVCDLIGLILISADAYSNPIMYVQQTLTAFTSDINLSMRADIMAKSILQRFTNEKN